MTIKDELCPRIKADAKLMGDGTLWIKTDKLDNVGRVLVEHGTRCKQFYQDAQPEQPSFSYGHEDDLISRQAAIEAVMECYDNDELFEVYEEKLRELPPAQPEPHWIPVTERLPEEYCECLVAYRIVDMQEFMDILEYEPSYEFDYEKGRFKGEWLFAADDERFTDGEVLAWMPLPEPYKGVTE